jgi:hypothetical protein
VVAQGEHAAVAIANFAHRFGMRKLPNCVPTLIALSELGNTETQELAGITIAGLSSQSDQLENGSVSALLSLLEEHSAENRAALGQAEPLAMRRMSGAPGAVGAIVADMPFLSSQREQRDEAETWELSQFFDDNAPRQVSVPQLAFRTDDNIHDANEVQISDWADRVHNFGRCRPMLVPCSKVRVEESDAMAETHGTPSRVSPSPAAIAAAATPPPPANRTARAPRRTPRSSKFTHSGRRLTAKKH